MYTQNDFKNMRFKVHGINDIEKIAWLKDIPSVKGLNPARKLATVKYFAYMYDQNSPLFSRVSDVAQRKKEASRIAGFEISKDIKYLEQIWGLTQETYVKIVVEMMKVQNNHELTMLVSLENYFYALNERLLRPLQEGDDMEELKSLETKGKLRKEMLDTKVVMTELYNSLFKGDKVLEEKVMRTSRFSPENVAIELSKIEND